MGGRQRRGSGWLVGALIVGAVGFVAIQEFVQPVPTGGPTGVARSATDAATHPAPAKADVVPARPSGAFSMTVEHVHDGDTLFMRTNRPNALVPSTDPVKVRLVGIDTPEVGDSAECFGAEATQQLRTLLPDGSTAWITADRDPTDGFGRSLFYVWTNDGRFVNYELVAGGAAEALMIAPNDAYYPLLRAAEDSAVAAGAGMWGAC